MDLGFIDKLKNPFSSEKCNLTESKVETVRLSERYVTLRCDNYLIYNEKTSDLSKVKVYEVTDWSLEKPEGENVDEVVLYNCERSDGTMLFPTYREEGAFLYGYNKVYSNKLRNISAISPKVCNVVSNTFYRTRTEIVK